MVRLPVFISVFSDNLTAHFLQPLRSFWPNRSLSADWMTSIVIRSARLEPLPVWRAVIYAIERWAWAVTACHNYGYRRFPFRDSGDNATL